MRPAPPPPLHVRLLGGFRVERVGATPPVSWQRRAAKSLVKLLATCPRHALHREQVLEILWRDADAESARNSFGKALYAARRALEPELLPREGSAYVRLSDSIVALETRHVSIDADRFELLARRALRRDDPPAYEAALTEYGGELLPEDRYADWCAERRGFLAELHVRLLLALADAEERRGASTAAEDRLREAVHHDPTREEAHRRLMVMYASAGRRDRAVRQFHYCREAMRRELGLAPQGETAALYQDILAERIPAPTSSRSSLLATA